MQSACKTGPQVLRWIFSLVCGLAACAAVAGEAGWEWRTHAGARVEVPREWQVQNSAPEAIAYARVDEAAGHTALFAYGWEEDPAQVRADLEAQGFAFSEGGRRTVAGIDCTELVVTPPAGAGPIWMRHLVARQPRPDGRFLIVQLAVGGMDDPTPDQPTLERILRSLEGAPDPARAPAAAAATGTAETAAPPAAVPAAAGAGAAAAQAEGGTPDQEALATQLFTEIAALSDSDLSGIESLYLRLIDQCPDTLQAQESYWRLSNLYIQAHEPPRRADAIALLERYQTHYPQSNYLEERFPMFVEPGLSLVSRRLLTLYQEEGQWEKALPIYQGFLTSPTDLPEERLPHCLGYADTLERLGRNADARTWYQVYVDRNPDPNDTLVGIARTAIERLAAAGAEPKAATATAPAPTAPPAAPEVDPPKVDPPKVAPPKAATPEAPTPEAIPAQPAPVAPTAPATPVAPAGDAEALAREGRERLAAGDYAGALEQFRASVALKPDPQLQERIRKLETYLGSGPSAK